VDKLSELLVREHGERFCTLWSALVSVYRAEILPLYNRYLQSQKEGETRHHAYKTFRKAIMPYRAKLFRSIAELKKEDHDNGT